MSFTLRTSTVPILLVTSKELLGAGERIGCVFTESWPPKAKNLQTLPTEPAERWVKRALSLPQEAKLAISLPSDLDEELLILGLGMILSRCKVSHLLLISERDINIAQLVLTSLELLHVGVDLVSCPTCGRCKQELENLVNEVKEATKGITTPLTVAVMGCEVNGPGEARHADCGVAASASGGILFRKGKVIRKLKSEAMAQALIDEVFKLAQEAEK